MALRAMAAASAYAGLGGQADVLAGDRGAALAEEVAALAADQLQLASRAAGAPRRSAARP